ncbi:hypothetical protein A3Q29_20165 [Providencia stuartii]|uniref:Uncharacterized protein n=1 Tax=Providencia stuartii TaxID=588 RepID=A0A1S1HMY9_PROST|nr:hypothetical protein A3Q29_20165 [Providencia stuartii]
MRGGSCYVCPQCVGAAVIGVVRQDSGSLVIGANCSPLVAAGTSADSGGEYSVGEPIGVLSVAVTTTGGSTNTGSARKIQEKPYWASVRCLRRKTRSTARHMVLSSVKEHLLVTDDGIDITAGSGACCRILARHIVQSASVALAGDRPQVPVTSTHPGINTTAVTDAGRSDKPAVLTAEPLDG